MTKWMTDLKWYEMDVWEHGSTWQRARIAYRHNAMSALKLNELREICDTVAEMNFYAEMSDDWNVTRKEKMENNGIANAAREELANR